MRFHLSSGFSAVELLVSLSIIIMLALTTAFALGGNKDRDELQTAARVLAGDLRSVQSRAFSGQNILVCQSGVNYKICETDATGCTGPCGNNIPLDYGLYAMTATSTYILFADVMSATPNYRYDGAAELLQKRDLKEFSKNVTISAVSSTSGLGVSTAHTSSSATFVRQNGQAKLIGFTALEPAVLSITLRHAKTGNTLIVELNRVTGRVTIL